MAELKKQNELLRQQLQQAVSLSLASSSSAPLPSSSSAALPSPLHHPPYQQSRSTLLAAPSIIFTPQQFSSVQPPSQDLLSSVRQHNNNYNMSSSQTVGEQPSLARYLVLGATLESKIKSKICQGGYVDLGALSSPTDTAVSVAMGNIGQPTISLTPMRTSPPSSILEWLRLFGTYAGIYLQAHADEASSLMRYMVAIMDISKCHGGYSWRVYDEKFRRIRALSPTLQWHLLLNLRSPRDCWSCRSRLWYFLSPLDGASVREAHCAQASTAVRRTETPCAQASTAVCFSARSALRAGYSYIIKFKKST